MTIPTDPVVNVVTIPTKEARARLRAAGICPQCVGAGVYRTLEKRNGKIVTLMVDCHRCKGKGKHDRDYR